MSEHNYMKIKDTVDKSLHSKKLDNLLRYCQNNDTLFVDKEFPPDKNSLIGNPIAQDYNGQWESIDWKRASQLFGQGQYDLFKGISPNDIRQGALGNCYFLCSLASLAEYPSLISRLFDFDHCNEYGIQSVWLNINGIWQQIILDEYFPSNGNQLAFSKTDQNELWVILLEKAYAKAYGCYWEIIGGDPVHALRDLTGAPYDRIDDFKDLDKAWQKLMTSNINQYMLTCFTYSTEQVEEQSNEGLVSGHAYTILDVRQVIDSQGNQRRIVQIRNPWGQFEWNGDFSDNSPLWTQKAKQKLQVKRNDDGIFWMPFEDFVNRFQGVGILKVIPGAVSNAVQINQNNSNKSIVRLKVRNNSQMMISVNQIDSRLLDNQQYEYSYIRVTLGKLEKDHVQFIDSLLSPERNIFIEKKLMSGEYVILIETYWNNDITRKLNIGTYSTGNNALQKMTIKQDKYDQIEYLIWKNFCQKNQNLMEHKGNSQVRGEVGNAELQKFCINKQKFANVVYSFVNTSNNNTIREVLDIDQHNGFDLNGKLTTSNKADLIINPQDNDIVLFKMDPRSNGFSLSYKTFNRELIEGKFSDNKLALQLIKEMGGIQMTPDNPQAKIQSKVTEEQNYQENLGEIQLKDQQRMQKLKERQQAVEQKKNQILQEMKEQAEFYAKNGGLSQGFMGNNLANLAMKMQSMPLENQWSNRFIETMTTGQKKTVCNIF